MTVIQTRGYLTLYLLVIVISNLHTVIVAAIKGSDELGLLTLKHYHYLQDKQWKALGRLLQISARKLQYGSQVRLRVNTFTTGGRGDGRRNEYERKSVHETEKKRLCMCLSDERGNKSSPQTELMSGSVFMRGRLCVCERLIYRRNKGRN